MKSLKTAPVEDKEDIDDDDGLVTTEVWVWTSEGKWMRWVWEVTKDDFESEVQTLIMEDDVSDACIDKWAVLPLDGAVLFNGDASIEEEDDLTGRLRDITVKIVALANKSLTSKKFTVLRKAIQETVRAGRVNSERR